MNTMQTLASVVILPNIEAQISLPNAELFLAAEGNSFLRTDIVGFMTQLKSSTKSVNVRAEIGSLSAEYFDMIQQTLIKNESKSPVLIIQGDLPSQNGENHFQIQV